MSLRTWGVMCSVEDKLKAVLNLRTVVELVEKGGQFQGLQGRLRVWWKHMGSLVKDLFIRGLGEGIRISML